jgi:excisionase family DNA binding protein
MTFYTTEEIATLLKVNPETVRRWVRSGDLKAVKLGGKYNRISQQALDAFIQKQV